MSAVYRPLSSSAAAAAMHNKLTVKTYNAISPKGLERYPSDLYKIGLAAGWLGEREWFGAIFAQSTYLLGKCIVTKFPKNFDEILVRPSIDPRQCTRVTRNPR